MSRYSPNNAAQLVFFVLLVHSICALCSDWGVRHPKIRCIEAERQALVKFKENLEDNNHILSSWGNEEEKQECCNWVGVRCANKSSTSHVLMLNLSSSVLDIFGKTVLPWKALSGNIGSSLVELKYLNYLDLTGIDFYWYPIPSFIGSLTKLRYLNLSSTGLSGEIPPQLANLTNLEFLDLKGNSNLRSNNLGWLYHISSLRELALSGTIMSGANDWVQIVHKLPYLTKLYLSDCQLPDIVPSSPILLTNSSRSLSTLDLSRNSLSVSLYKWLFKFSNGLIHLDLKYNLLEGCIPEAFGNMTMLAYLDIGSNNLKCSIPKAIGNLSRLAYLNLDENLLEGEIPESIWSLCSLQTLSLKYNNLSGQLPDLTQPLFRCSNYSLQNMLLASNHLTGSLSSCTLVPSLKEIELASNLLNGTIPESIGQLTNLEALHISRNHFHGVISESHFSKLSKLSSLDLAYNSFVLNISIDWNPPFQLDAILLGSCKLGPQFPKWIQTQNNYTILDVSNAGISDSIPELFWDKHSIRDVFILNLSSNQISGIIKNSSSWEYSTNAFALIDLSSNELEGSLPLFLFKANDLRLSKNKFSKINSLCDILDDTNLSTLDLSHNKLFGELPDCWSHLQHLNVLSLANNKLSGRIPKSIGASNEMLTLHLENNNFIGELPSTLKNCTDLRLLSVGGNKLSGSIPIWIGENLQYLRILSFRSNQFYGSMPSNLCSLVSLQVLDLSLNNISGNVPRCLRNLTAMRTTAYASTVSFVIDGETTDDVSFYDELLIEWKGTLSIYRNTLALVKSIDLSSNKLTGEIPGAITELIELISLNLSRNNFSGTIPSEIGFLKSLDTLDLSNNHLIGRIPSSLSKVDRLGVLDLSNNNLSGEIPIGTQLQSFNATFYIGNSGLCGAPLPKCPKESTRPTKEGGGQEDEDEDKLITPGFYVSLGVGFVIGFWGVCGTLIFNSLGDISISSS